MGSQLTDTDPARTRTPRQLQRKRALDKESQRRKRERQRAHVQQIEKELHDARQEIHNLRLIIQDMKGQPQPGTQGIDSVRSSAHDSCPPQLESPVSVKTASTVTPCTHRSLSPQPEHKEQLIECFCEPQTHESFSECFEKTVFASVIEWNSRSILLAAVYILAYRILRYRFFPSVETHNDVPEWLRSTDIQDKIPHALYIDFVQFPRLRNAMVLGLVNIDSIREQFDADFGRHLSVNWPVSEALLVTDSSRNTILNPKFERHICTQENWTLDSVFATKYPHIAPLIV
ncbi:hypothetical protein G7Z17_g13097 [Cylindrodendrum hubeiense]|uniref:BZIP domain-containing protein n=1 Tax=Cylindrodendrum hubeiense TaxID=595255 RepID=A0A9P5GXQ3_9HYPO|nr:hypothetical protein G7Z17_g13097 [Cylindrodendrum hubeiense]